MRSLPRLFEAKPTRGLASRLARLHALIGERPRGTVPFAHVVCLMFHMPSGILEIRLAECSPSLLVYYRE